MAKPQTIDIAALTVLVADPNPHMLKILRAMLRSLGVSRIFESQNGAKALEELKAHTIDIVIVDYELTNIDGTELSEILRNDETSVNRFVPIIILSASTEKWRIEKARDSGATEFLRKPLSANDLYQRLIQVIDNPRPFVHSNMFIGPDRRRRRPDDYRGQERRTDRSSNTDIDNIFNDL